MIEHPLPQNITAYQFHLIGNMTVKQFLVLLVGVGIGFGFYSTNLPFLIKWFLIIFVFLMGVAIAFVPYESRTLDQWIWNFVKAIYRPTKYFWIRQAKTPHFFEYTQRTDVQRQQDQLDLTPYKRQQVKQYLSSLSGTAAVAADPLDVFDQRSGEISSLFSNVEAARNVQPAVFEEIQKPELQVRARPLRPSTMLFQTGKTATTLTSNEKSTQKVAVVTPPTRHSSATAPVAQGAQTVAANLPEQKPAAPTAAPSNQAQVIPKNVLQVAPAAIGPSEAETATETAQVMVAPSQGDSAMYAQADQVTSSSQRGEQVLPAIFSTELPFPSLPDQPNLLIGMAHDTAHQSVAGAIVEILDQTGNTVRAMKTNALGQFYISSPLPNGSYRIETEKDGVHFPVYSFEATGTVLNPVDIQATESSTLATPAVA